MGPIADKYTNITVSNGSVSGMDTNYKTIVLGQIGRVELAIEQPENMLGIYRVEHIMIYNDHDDELYDDQSLVDNTEYHSEEELIEDIASQYGISADLIEQI